MESTPQVGRQLYEIVKRLSAIESRLAALDRWRTRTDECNVATSDRLAAVESWIRKAETMTLGPGEYLIRCSHCQRNWKPPVNTVHIPGDLCPDCSLPPAPSAPNVPRVEATTPDPELNDIRVRCRTCGQKWVGEASDFPIPGDPCPKCAENFSFPKTSPPIPEGVNERLAELLEEQQKKGGE